MGVKCEIAEVRMYDLSCAALRKKCYSLKMTRSLHQEGADMHKLAHSGYNCAFHKDAKLTPLYINNDDK